jgi:predicted DNA-binding transcriptional regulator AlpA
MGEVREKTGLGASTIYAKVRESSFPQPVVLAVDKHGKPRICGWHEDEVVAWLAARPRYSSTLEAACAEAYAAAYRDALPCEEPTDEKARKIAHKKADAAARAEAERVLSGGAS